MSETPMLPIIEAVPARTVIPPMKYPYIILAYWGSGGWWKVLSDMYDQPGCDGINRKIAELQSKGWAHIHVVKLEIIK